MDSLPSELVLYLGQYLDRQSLAATVRTSSKYHVLLTASLYDNAITVIDPEKVIITLATATERNSLPPPWVGYEGTMMEHAKHWSSRPVMDYFSNKSLDSIMAPFLYTFMPMPHVGKTLLHECAETGNCVLAEVLLRRGAQVDLRTHGGETPLHFGAGSRHSSVEMIQLLVSFGADIMAQTYTGASTVYLAAASSREDILNAALDMVRLRGGDPFAPTHGGLTPLHSAARVANTAALRLFLQNGANVMHQASDGQTALHMASNWGKSSACQLLIDAMVAVGGDISTPTSTNLTPLHLAIAAKSEAVAGLLVLSGADVVARDDLGRMPVILALENNLHEIVRMLPDLNADAWPISDLNLLLDRAASRQELKTLNLVLDLMQSKNLALDLEQANSGGVTILHKLSAAAGCQGQNDMCETIQRLVCLGVSVNVVRNDRDNDTPLHSLLKGTGPGPKVDQYYKTLKLLVERSTDLKLADSRGSTPLHIAANGGDENACSIMLARSDGQGIVNVRDAKGYTPLHHAALIGRKAIIQLLLTHGASISSTNDHGQSALHLAASSGGTNVSLLQILVQAGATVSLKCDSGNPAMHYAVEAMWDDGVGYLVEAGSGHEGCDDCERRIAPWRLFGPSRQRALQMLWDDDQNSIMPFGGFG